MEKEDYSLFKKVIAIIIAIVVILVIIGIYSKVSNQNSEEVADTYYDNCGKIVFSVSDQNGNPIVGQSYSLTRTDGTEIGTVATGTDGMITYYNVPVGDYVIELVEDEEESNEENETENLSTTVTVEEGQTSYATLTNEILYGTLTIRVVDDTASVLEGATFNVYDEDGYLMDTFVTDEEGKIAISYTAGRYYFQEKEVEGNYTIDDTLYAFEINDENLTFYKTVTNERYKGYLLLVVTDDNGEPVSGITYMLYDENKEEMLSTTTNEDGLAGISNIPAGKTYYYKQVGSEDSEYVEFTIEEDEQIVRQDITINN